MNGRALLAWNVRKIRTSQGLSQEKLAADAGVDRAYLGGIEREQENPSIDTLDKIAAALSVRVGSLLAEPRSGEKPPRPLPAGRRSTLG